MGGQVLQLDSSIETVSLYIDVMSKTSAMFKYEVILYWSKEDNAFVAEVPELPGCMADGKTYEQALRMLEKLPRNGLKRQKNWAVQSPIPKDGWFLPESGFEKSWKKHFKR